LDQLFRWYLEDIHVKNLWLDERSNLGGAFLIINIFFTSIWGFLFKGGSLENRTASILYY
jgi:hypothetical protein